MEVLGNNWLKFRELKTGAGSGADAPVPLGID